MRTATIFALASGAAASGLSCKGSDPCLDSTAAKNIASQYAAVIGPTYTDKLALSFLTSDFKDTSDSINSLISVPLGTTTFPSRKAFMASQNAQKANNQLAPLNVKKTAYGRSTVTVVWTMSPGKDIVKGVSLLNMKCESGNWKLQTLDAEFNSFPYNNDIGGTCTVSPAIGGSQS